MTKHLIIESLCALLVVANVGGCGGSQGSGVVAEPPANPDDGKIAMEWTVSGAPLTAADCTQQGIQYMVVDLASPDGDQQEYIEVTCALDRYSLENTPQGLLQVTVTGVSVNGPELCAHLQGQATLTAGTDYPDTPTPVPLTPAAFCTSSQ